MDVSTFWMWASGLPGETIQTVTGRPFAVVAASRSGGITLVPESTGKLRTVTAEEFDKAIALRLRGRDLSPWRIQHEGASEYNSAYVAAILRRYASDSQTMAPATSASEAAYVSPTRPQAVVGQARQGTVRLAGSLLGVPRPSYPDRQGRSTAWAGLMCQGEFEGQTRSYSCVFHGATTDPALTLPAGARIVVEGYLRPREDREWDTFSVVRIVSADNGGQFLS